MQLFCKKCTQHEGGRMTGPGKPPSYHIFMLKCWPEHQQSNGFITSWRFSLEDPNNGQRKGFAQLDDLLLSIRQQLQSIMAGEG